MRQGNFVGAGVNTVTKSGTNQFSGSAYYFTRDESYVGKQAGANAFNPGTFNFSQLGARLSGPLIKNRLFFFSSIENDADLRPGILRTARQGTEPITGRSS